MPVIHPNTPHVIPADAGNQRKTKHAVSLPFAQRRGRVRSTQGMPEIHRNTPSHNNTSPLP